MGVFSVPIERECVRGLKGVQSEKKYPFTLEPRRGNAFCGVVDDVSVALRRQQGGVLP